MDFTESFMRGMQMGGMLQTMREQNRLRAIRDKILGQYEYDAKNHVSLPANFSLAGNQVSAPDLRAETNAAVMPVPDIRAKAPAPVPGQFKITSLADLVPKPAPPLVAPKPIDLRYTQALSMPELVAKNPMAFALAGIHADMIPWGGRTQSENRLASLIKGGQVMDATDTDRSKLGWYKANFDIGKDLAEMGRKQHVTTVESGSNPDIEGNIGTVARKYGYDDMKFGFPKTRGYKVEKAEAETRATNALTKEREVKTEWQRGKPYFKPDAVSTPGHLKPLFEQAAGESGVPVSILEGVALAESSFRPGALSPAGAIGLMQLMPDTAKGLGVNPHDPAQNVRGGAKYLRQMYDYFGDWSLAFAAYNAGPGAVENAISRAGSRSWEAVQGYLPAETRNYVPAVFRAINTPQKGQAKLGEAEKWAQKYELGQLHTDQAVIDQYNANIDKDTGDWKVDSMLTNEQKIALDKDAQGAMARMNQFYTISSGGKYRPGGKTTGSSLLYPVSPQKSPFVLNSKVGKGYIFDGGGGAQPAQPDLNSAGTPKKYLNFAQAEKAIAAVMQNTGWDAGTAQRWVEDNFVIGN